LGDIRFDGDCLASGFRDQISRIIKSAGGSDFIQPHGPRFLG